jgi:hypothetical protein
MIRRSPCLALFATLALMAPAPGAKAILATNPVPEYKEVYELIHSHLDGVTDAELDQAALNGLLTTFDGRVSLEEDQSTAPTNGPLISRVAVPDEGVGYVRISRVADGLAQGLGQAWRDLVASNALNGLVLDLRFARGSDYAAAAAAADLFVPRERQLLVYGDVPVRSTAKTNAVTLPLAVLVNHATSGAAEALAAMLREAGSAIILGDTTAGRAMVMQDYPLKNGQRLSIAAEPVKLGNGAELSSSGVKADIQVAVSADAEKTYFDDPYPDLSQAYVSDDNAQSDQVGETNHVTHHARISEADLVREKAEGISSDDDTNVTSQPTEPEKPMIHDPVLARAVDLLKALALVHDQRN